MIDQRLFHWALDDAEFFDAARVTDLKTDTEVLSYVVLAQCEKRAKEPYEPIR
jgi:hypothetical protein